MNSAIDTVHTAQQTLTIDYNDISASDDYSGVVGESAEKPKSISKFGVITCENAGLNADAYYGINRVSLRDGAGVKSNSSLPGDDGEVAVYGYASTAFKALQYVEIGDVITFETSWGVYQYQVTDIVTSSKAPKSNAGQSLVLASSKNSKAFADFSDEKLFVLADLISSSQVEVKE
jgi:LPXTG-site transpeptidase (sortase) family protein